MGVVDWSRGVTKIYTALTGRIAGYSHRPPACTVQEHPLRDRWLVRRDMDPSLMWV